MLRKTFTVLSIICAHIVHALAFLVPRSEKIWVCIGWHNSKKREIFADNSKYFFLYLQNQKPETHSVWLARDKKLASILSKKGYRAYYDRSLLGIYYALRAGFTVVDARITRHNWQFCTGSKVIQLWHGKGMKKSGVDGNYNNKHTYLTSPNNKLRYKKLVATSEKTAELLSKAFEQPVEDIMITGQPRTDVFFRKIKGAEIDEHETLNKYIKDAKNNGMKKIILYAPTFRADGSNPLNQFDGKKLEAFNSFLQKNSYLLILSLHPKFANKEKSSTQDYSNILNIDPGFDLYPYFHKIDTVITDYSNIYIDFLLLNKQTIFFTYDEAYYRESTGLNDDFDTLTPGPHVTTTEELLSVLDKEDTYEKDRQRVRDILFSQQDGLASERIYEELTRE